MAVGPQLRAKFVWLMDNVEVKGIVRRGSAPDGTDLWDAAHDNRDNDNSSDWFDIVPDANYAHLITAQCSGRIHCETYVEGVTTDPTTINKVAPYPIGTKPAEPFRVLNPTTGKRQNLRVGDHVRVIGRWVIDHHPENCVTRYRGWLKVGCAHVEFHPFRWDQIILLADANRAERQETLSLAAPIHEEVYLGSGKHLANEVAGVANCIFIAEDGTNYHRSVTADVHIKAPSLPAGFTPDSTLISFAEKVTKIGAGLDPSTIRRVDLVNDGIRVLAQVSADIQSYTEDGVAVGDMNDPGNDRSLFQAQYAVRWLPRLIGYDVTVAPTSVGATTLFQVDVYNRGPDSLEILSAFITQVFNTRLQMDPISGLSIAPRGAGILTGTFSPTAEGTFFGEINIISTDPAHPQLKIHISAMATPPQPKLDANPLLVDFGTVQLGMVVVRQIAIRNIGAGDARILEVTKNNLPRLVPGNHHVPRVPVGVDHLPFPISHPAGEEQFQIPPYFYLPGSIPKGAIEYIPIWYAPNVEGRALADIKLIADDGRVPALYREELTIRLLGRGIPRTIAFQPPVLQFGKLAVNEQKYLDLRITNQGNAALTVLDFSGDSLQGSFVLDPAVHFPLQPIASGVSATIRVHFTAPAKPGLVVVDWEMITSPPQVSPAMCFLTGESTSLFPLDIFPEHVDFHRMRQRSASQQVLIRNRGKSDFKVVAVELQKGSEFSIGRVPNLPFTIAAGKELPVDLKFRPLKPGFYQDELLVKGEDLERPSVRVSLQALRLPGKKRGGRKRSSR